MHHVTLHALLAFVTVERFVALQAVALADIVHQFLYQHRRVAFAVILNGAADIADIERFFRRHHRFKEQIAVIVATASVAAYRFLAHQVKAERRQCAWVNTVVHAQQAHHFERDGAHWHQGTNVNWACQEALADAFLIEALRQFVTQQRQRHLTGVLRLHALGDNRLPLLLNQRQSGFRVLIGQEEIVQHLTAHRQPFLQRTRLRQHLPPAIKLHQQRGQVPNQFGNQAAGLIIRQHLLPFALLALHRVAQQHTREAKAPGMLPGSR